MDRKFYLILLLVVALGAAEAYLYTEMRSLGTETGRIREAVAAQLSTVRERGAEVVAADRESLEQMFREVEATKRESAMAAMLAKYQAQARAEQLAADIARAQRREREEVTEKLATVRAETADTAGDIAALEAGAASVRKEYKATNADVAGTASHVARVRNELDDMSRAIAMNRTELEALRSSSSDREFVEFTLAKSKKPQDVAGLRVLLKKADPSRNLFTLEVTAGNETIVQKDRNIHEPLRLVLEPGHRHYEMVVYDVAKDRVTGYITAPKEDLTASK